MRNLFLRLRTPKINENRGILFAMQTFQKNFAEFIFVIDYYLVDKL